MPTSPTCMHQAVPVGQTGQINWPPHRLIIGNHHLLEHGLRVVDHGRMLMGRRRMWSS